jgi:hypothetical protein
MTDTKNYKAFQKLSWKDIQELLIVSDSTAQRYLNDIKQSYSISIVTYNHFKKYFKIA